MAPSEGYAAQFCIDAAAPIDTSSLPIMIQSESLILQSSHIDTSGIRGTRQHDSTRVVQGNKRISGTISLIPTADELEYILPYIQGAVKATNDYIPSEAGLEFVCAIDRVGKVFTYSGCRVAKATFRASQGEAMTLDLDIEAESESVGNAGTFPALTYKSDYPYVFSGGVLTLVSSTRSMFDFEIVIDNMPDTERFMNSVTRADIPYQDRMVTAKFTTPYTSAETDLYAQAVAGSAASLVLTNAGGDALTFTFGRLQVPEQSPGVPGKQEIKLTIDGVARRVSSTNDLVITHILSV